MVVYVICTKLKTTNPEKFAEYTKIVPTTLKDHEFSLLSAFGPFEVLEGQQNEGTVLLEFPTKEAALKWYHSPEYQEVAKLRLSSAEFNVVLIEGK